MPPSYVELKPSPQGQWLTDRRKGDRNFDAERILLCEWSDRASMISWLFSGGLSYPHADGPSASIVKDIKTLGYGRTSGSGGLISYLYAILRIKYSTKGPGFINDLFQEEYLREKKIHQYPVGDSLRWSDEIYLTPQDCRGIRFWGWQHVLRISNAATYPTGIMALINTCNATPITCVTFDIAFPAQTVLYVPPFMGSTASYTEGMEYSYQYNHLINPFEWNRYWRAETSSWERVYMPDGELYVQHPPV